MEVDQQSDRICVTGRNNRDGVSVAHIFSPVAMQTEQTDTFFSPPDNWKKVTDNTGRTVRYPNHWHFTATTQPVQSSHFLTIIDTHGTDREDAVIRRENNRIYVEDWLIECNLVTGTHGFRISNEPEKIVLEYDPEKNEGRTCITESSNGKVQYAELEDVFPELVI